MCGIMVTDTPGIVSGLNQLFDQGSSVEKEILSEVLSLDNLDRKTDLGRPITWAILTAVQNFLKVHALSSSSNILEQFVETSFRYLISKNRRGRQEYVQGLQAFAEAEKEKIRNETHL